jgi:alpha/beta superfamily hydrolase
MGATWKHDTMFSCHFIKDNFETLLYNAGVETVAVDYSIDDTYDSIVDAVKPLANKVDYIFGYSYGCLIALSCVTHRNNGIILLDPKTVINHNQRKYIKDIDTANIYFDRDISNKNQNLASISKLRFSPVRKPTHLIWSDYGYHNNTIGDIGRLMAQLQLSEYKIENSSHYIIMEDTRIQLANKTLEIMNA